MGLGQKRTGAGFHALLERARQDEDPNVRAEAASAPSWFSFERCTSLLLQLFAEDDHWLVRHSILAALSECDDPGAQMQVVHQVWRGMTIRRAVARWNCWVCWWVPPLRRRRKPCCWPPAMTRTF